MPNDDDRAATSTGESVDPALDATQLSPGHTAPSSPLSGLAVLPPGARIGRYEIRDVLGSGGMGVVYRARDPELDRELAIKIVLPGSASAKAQQRLLDEARAMAKLRHPNVIPVFDVGTTEHGVYIVMPLVSGGTIHDWLRSERRPWRQVLERFMAAGRGLDAAHKAGLIHRDFKPKNVLLGDAGEVLVADFGIAADVGTASSEDSPNSGSVAVSSIAGTPAYMAPEQAASGKVDARADQYSFCISLWEGLHGVHPQEAETRERAALAVPRLGPRRDAPQWLLAAVNRGFAPVPERRWPSMQAFLDHIGRRLRRPRRMAWASGFAFVVAGATASTLILAPSPRASACPDPRPRLQGIWDASIRDRMNAAFAATRATVARETLTRVLPALDAYADAWRAMHIEACRATNVSHTQSPDLLDRRMVCLDRRLGMLGTLTSTLASTSSARLIERATSLVGGLPEIADCEKSDRLLALMPQPADPRTRSKIEQLEKELDAITALKWRGEHVEQLRRASEAVTAARGLEYLPLLARALSVQARAENDNGQRREAINREAAVVASRAGDDALAASAWLSLISDLSSNEARYDEARMLESVAQASIERAGSPPPLVYRQLVHSAIRMAYSGEEGAKAKLETAIGLAVTPQQRAEARGMLAKVVMMSEGPSKALPLAEASLATYEQLFGPNHPLTADEAHFLAQVLVYVGDLARAETLTRRALDIQLRSVSPDSSAVAMSAHTLGSIASELEHWTEARTEFERAATLFETHGDTRRQSHALHGLAGVIGKSEGLNAALPVHARALELLEKSVGRNHAEYAELEVGLAVDLIENRKCREAEVLLQHASTVYAKHAPSSNGKVLELRARCHLQARRADEAIRTLEQADAACRAGDCEVPELVRWNLGRLLIERSRDQARGLELITEAREGWKKRGMAARVTDVDDWLSRRTIGQRRPPATP